MSVKQEKMRMGMTSNEKNIVDLTGKEVGKVYLGRDLKHGYFAQTEGNRVLDCETGNFHLFPILSNAEEWKKWGDYQKKEASIRQEIQKKIQKEYPEAKWGNGRLTGIPKQYSKLNHFFCCMQIKKSDRYYTIVLKRFFIDKENKVNCIFGDVQFISSTKKGPKEFVNEFYGDKVTIETFSKAQDHEGYNCKKELVRKIKVNYPQSYRGQNTNMIHLSKKKDVSVYNPIDIKNLKDVSENEMEQYAGKVAESFSAYITYIGNALASIY